MVAMFSRHFYKTGLTARLEKEKCDIFAQHYQSQPVSVAFREWSGGAKVLGKLTVPGRPTSLDNSRTRAYCACSRCGWGLF